MALPHELPILKPDVNDLTYQRFVWARFLRGEVAYASRKGKLLVTVTLDGALEIADALDPR